MTINGLSQKELHEVQRLLMQVADDFGTIGSTLAASAPAATWDRCRIAASNGTQRLATLRMIISHALEHRAWCDLCGDGAPGEIATREGELKPCNLCGADASATLRKCRA